MFVPGGPKGRRTSSFGKRRKKERNQWSPPFPLKVIVVLLVIAGLETNPGPSTMTVSMNTSFVKTKIITVARSLLNLLETGKTSVEGVQEIRYFNKCDLH